jgi:hypothetical protein
MFFGLRHHSFVGSDDEQGQVYSAYAGQHILDEMLMPWYIDDTYLPAAGQLQPGEAEVDGHAPFLFFLQTVGVYAGERLYQSGLAVVYMARSAEHKH